MESRKQTILRPREYLFRDVLGLSCGLPECAEFSRDRGATWHPRPTRAEVREDAVRCIAAIIKSRMPPGSVVELRILGAPGGRTGTHEESGLFTSSTEFARAALRHSGEARGVYYCINPVHILEKDTDLNSMAWCRGVKDTDISQRGTLFIDIDSERPDKGQPATDDEKAHALSVTVAIRDHLNSLGWPAPQLQDSGNGFYLIYRIDLPANDGGVVQRILLALADRFGPTVDTSVFNPSRISRVPRTWNCKGDDTSERPHRLSRLIEWPEPFLEVPDELLFALADSWTEPATMDGANEAPCVQKCVPSVRNAAAYMGDVPLEKRLRRAAAYQPLIAPAIQGQNGSRDTFKAFQAILIGFALANDVDAAMPILEAYSARCRPPWEGRELAHKIEDVLTKSRLPPGYLLTERSGRKRRKSKVEMEPDELMKRCSEFSDYLARGE